MRSLTNRPKLAVALYRDGAMRLSLRTAWRLSGELAKELS